MSSWAVAIDRWSTVAGAVSRRRNLFTGTVWSLGGAVGSRAVMLASYILLARFLGRDSFGQFAIVQNTSLTFGVLASTGLGIAATKLVAEFTSISPERAHRLLGLTEAIGSLLSIVAAAVLMSASPWIAAHILGNEHLAGALCWSAFLPAATIFNAIDTGALTGRKEFRAVAAINTVGALATGICALAGSKTAGVNGAVCGWVVGAFLTSVLAWLTVHVGQNSPQIRVCSWWLERRTLLHFSIPAMASSLVLAPAVWMGNVLLTHAANGFRQVALFAVAQQWHNAILFVPLATAPVALSFLSEAKLQSRSYWDTARTFLLINGGMAVTAALAICLASPLLISSYGSGFLEGTRVLQIMAVAAVFSALCSIVGQINATSVNMWWGVALNTIWAGVFLVLATHWTRSLGATGLALSFCMAYINHFIFSIAYIWMRLRRKIQGASF